jgi:hypothetical protein
MMPSCAPPEHPLVLPAFGIATRRLLAGHPVPFGVATKGKTPPVPDPEHGQAGNLLPPGISPVTLPGLEPGGSLSSVLQRRLGQLAHGHTVEQDAGDLVYLRRRAEARLHDVADRLTMAPPCATAEEGAANQLARRKAARKAAVDAAALCLALIDALDFIERAKAPAEVLEGMPHVH